MNLKENINSGAEQESEPTIIIRKSIEAPPEMKENPFYDPEFWGKGDSPDNIYLPDSDEALSFAMAAHEIGHLVKEGQQEGGLDNFESQSLEEQRAWDVGWSYIEQYFTEYFEDKPDTIPKIRQAYEEIKVIFAEAMKLSKGLYLEKGLLDHKTPDERSVILKQQREKFFF
ncbi:MAG: hypothetical protein COV55_05165 [Candidatus Komeilibacteria bacterium CG11_big_fil_rev_8_21_14_0_20_36_20]|uniref:Uncharacterized protein n=1 Tax=Candidatus Komeilibacteria bacterium CG11_big_fil_rev_8_21_14_0_20_36_20 TaxID=1974477 RepID=A0A2H0ND44_9BACT|nr:MAG: hypothetical protein COV55_05165 [Candidatus Komeilibacteria bacterium CG11_big_fil_rev_8_21_14_0_20_36_20]PIR82088.1 MAG: hypothetical protein COU21_00410 [Candidatus Komeilibacteria bacterium CG10_big_fil_rev_8_21_14_0_10_36_65]PJC55691.1 MAG: hypothetical protein CO027_00660 [Candidatus Komeilibacteria bacterium CG_4_9_14_0_2_um_filter_36_13]